MSSIDTASAGNPSPQPQPSESDPLHEFTPSQMEQARKAMEEMLEGGMGAGPSVDDFDSQ